MLSESIGSHIRLDEIQAIAVANNNRNPQSPLVLRLRMEPTPSVDPSNVPEISNYVIPYTEAIHTRYNQNTPGNVPSEEVSNRMLTAFNLATQNRNRMSNVPENERVDFDLEFSTRMNEALNITAFTPTEALGSIFSSAFEYIFRTWGVQSVNALSILLVPLTYEARNQCRAMLLALNHSLSPIWLFLTTRFTSIVLTLSPRNLYEFYQLAMKNARDFLNSIDISYRAFRVGTVRVRAPIVRGKAKEKITKAREEANDAYNASSAVALQAARVEPQPRTFFGQVMDQTWADFAYVFSPFTVPYNFVIAFFRGMSLAFYAGRALTCTIIFSGGAFVIDLGITFFFGWSPSLLIFGLTIRPLIDRYLGEFFRPTSVSPGLPRYATYFGRILIILADMLRDASKYIEDKNKD